MRPVVDAVVLVQRRNLAGPGRVGGEHARSHRIDSKQIAGYYLTGRSAYHLDLHWLSRGSGVRHLEIDLTRRHKQQGRRDGSHEHLRIAERSGPRIGIGYHRVRSELRPGEREDSREHARREAWEVIPPIPPKPPP